MTHRARRQPDAVSDEQLDQPTAAFVAAALGGWTAISEPDTNGHGPPSPHPSGMDTDPVVSSLAAALGALFPVAAESVSPEPVPTSAPAVDRMLFDRPNGSVAAAPSASSSAPGLDVELDSAATTPTARTLLFAPPDPPATEWEPLPDIEAPPVVVVPREHVHPPGGPPSPPVPIGTGHTSRDESDRTRRHRRRSRPEPEPLSVATKLGVSDQIAEYLLRPDGRLFGTIPPREEMTPAPRGRGTRQALVSLLRQRRRLLLSVVSVALGVAYLAGSLSLLQRVSNGLAAQSGAGTEPADLVIEGDIAVSSPLEEVRRLVPHSLVEPVGRVPGVEAVDPRLEGSAVIAPLDGTSVVRLGLTEQPLGIGWPSVASLNPYEFRGDGRPPEEPDEVVIDARSADTAGVEVDEQVIVASKIDSTAFTVVGILDLDREQLPEGSSLAAFTPDTARRLFDLGDDDNAIAIKVSPDADIDDVRAQVDALLPTGAVVSDNDEYIDHRRSALAKSFTLIRLLLIGFAALALGVGAFTVANSMALLFDTRRRGFALLRLLGGSPSQLVRASLLEAVIAGAGAGLIGLFLGLAVGWGIERAIRTLGQPLPVAGSPLSWGIPLVALGIGIAVTALSAVWPARAAAAAAPVTAVTGADDVGTRRRRWPVFALAAVIVPTVAGAVIASVATAEGSWMIGAAVGLVIGVLVVFVPRALSGAVRRMSGWALASSPALSRLTLARSRGAATRTAATTAALLLAVGVVTGLTVLSSSFVTSIDGQVTRLVTADLVVDSGTFTRGGLPSAIIPALESTDGVSAVSGFRVGSATMGGAYVRVSAMNGEAMFDLFDLGIVGSEPAALGPDGIVLSEGLADALGVATGDLVPVTWQTGTVRSMTVDAVFDSPLTTLLGEAVVDSEVLAAELGTSVDALAVVSLDDPGDAESIAAVEDVGARFGAASVLAPDDLIGTRAELLRGFGRVIQWMLAFTVVLALIGVANTLQLSVNERRREIGLLRAVGGSRSQTLRLILTEAGVMSALGTVLGIGVGLAAAALTVRGLDAYGLDTLVIPARGVAVIAAAAIALSLAGALAPALTATRIPVLDAIADRQSDLTTIRGRRSRGPRRGGSGGVLPTGRRTRRVEGQPASGADRIVAGTDHAEDPMEHRCYNCGSDPGGSEICAVCGATQITEPVGMFSVQPKAGADAASAVVEPDLAPPPPTSAPRATPLREEQSPLVGPDAAPVGASATWDDEVDVDMQRAAADSQPTDQTSSASVWTVGHETQPEQPPTIPEDDIVDATVIEDDDMAMSTPVDDSETDLNGSGSIRLGSIFEEPAAPAGPAPTPNRSPFGQFANDESDGGPADGRWTTEDRDFADDAATAHHQPSTDPFATPPQTGRDAFAAGPTAVDHSSTFAPQSAEPPPAPRAAARDDGGLHGPDPHGLGVAARRMRPASRDDVAVALSIAAAMMQPDESVIGAVGGSILGTPSAIVATATRVIVVCDRRYAPEVIVFDLAPGLTVTGRHANDVASLTIADDSRSVSVDQILDVPLAVEVVNTIRTRSSGTEF